MKIVCNFNQNLIMCQNCFNRGYNDYPAYTGSIIEHKVDYIEGYKKKQYEILDADNERNTNYCKRCFENGIRNAQIGLWAPPLTNARGHYESYEKGYYQPSSGVINNGNSKKQESTCIWPGGCGRNYTWDNRHCFELFEC